MQSVAVYLQLRLVRKCSSLVQEQTLQNAYYMRSTVVWTANQNSR